MAQGHSHRSQNRQLLDRSGELQGEEAGAAEGEAEADGGVGGYAEV